MERYNYGEKNQTKLGSLGWLAIGAVALAWDVWGEETLTHAYRRGLDNPRTRALVLGGTALTVLHLTDNIPRSIDPYYALEKVGKAGLEVYRHVI